MIGLMVLFNLVWISETPESIRHESVLNIFANVVEAIPSKRGTLDYVKVRPSHADKPLRDFLKEYDQAVRFLLYHTISKQVRKQGSQSKSALHQSVQDEIRQNQSFQVCFLGFYDAFIGVDQAKAIQVDQQTFINLVVGFMKPEMKSPTEPKPNSSYLCIDDGSTNTTESHQDLMVKAYAWQAAFEILGSGRNKKKFAKIWQPVFDQHYPKHGLFEAKQKANAAVIEANRFQAGIEKFLNSNRSAFLFIQG